MSVKAKGGGGAKGLSGHTYCFNGPNTKRWR